MKKFRNIIFDLGGVVIDLQRIMAVKALDKLGITDASVLLGEYGQKGPFKLLETGEITAAQFFDLLLPACKPGTTCTDLQNAFEDFLKDLPEERLVMIRKLREEGFRLFVLSNTNPIMFHHWIDDAFRKEGKSVNDYFDGIVVSYEEKTMKPDPQIFRNLVERYRLNPSETLMLDDSEANCLAAESIGLSAVRIFSDGPDSFREVCTRLLEEGPLK